MPIRYLTWATAPKKPTPIDKVVMGCSKTKAWGNGGYYERLFRNMYRREPQGDHHRS